MGISLKRDPHDGFEKPAFLCELLSDYLTRFYLLTGMGTTILSTLRSYNIPELYNSPEVYDAYDIRKLYTTGETQRLYYQK